MIQFSCPCSYSFKLADDMAGAQVQCPRCKRLNDVPLAGDLPNLASDGTYNLDKDPARKTNPGLLASFERMYSKDTVDKNGQEIDLRQTADQLAKVGDTAVPSAASGQFLLVPPKYDPDSGQLIRPLDLHPTIAPPNLKPSPVQPSHRGGASSFDLDPGRFPLKLFSPGNLTVMLSIGLLHVLSQAMLILCLIRVLAAAPILLGGIFIIISHYANIIEEVGPENRDDLPRPARNASWSEDIWHPFINFISGMAVAYSPAAVTMYWLPADLPYRNWPIGCLLVAGTLVAPAALLAGTTSGTWLNLRPDRIAGVIRVCGDRYLFVVFLWTITAGIYVLGVLGMMMHWADFIFGEHTLPQSLPRMLVYLVLLAGIYLMHYYCCCLGLLYRAKHDQFPWVFQRHRRRDDRFPRRGLPPPSARR